LKSFEFWTGVFDWEIAKAVKKQKDEKDERFLMRFAFCCGTLRRL
jgi:hypothetical protein